MNDKNRSLEKQSFFSSLQFRIALLFSSVTVVLLIIFSLFGFIRERSLLQYKILSLLNIKVEGARADVVNWMNEKQNLLESWQDYLHQPGLLEKITLSGRSDNPYLITDRKLSLYIGLTDKRFFNGDSWLAPDDFDATTRPWYIRAVSEKTVGASYYRDAASQEPVLGISAPIFDDNHDILGVISTDIHLPELFDKISSYSSLDMSVAIIDPDGWVLAHSDESLIKSNLMEQEDSKLFMKKVYQIKNGTQSYTFQGVKKLMTFRQIPGVNWSILMFVTEKKIYAPLTSLAVTYIIFTLIGAVLFFIIASLVSYQIVGPIKKITRSLGAFAQGEGDLSVQLEIKKDDELGKLARNFNLFVLKMREMVNQIKSSFDDIQTIKDTLEANAAQGAAAITEVAANIQSIQKQIDFLNSSINTSAASVQQISASIVSLDNQMQDQARMVEQTSSSLNNIHSGLDTVTMISRQKQEIAASSMETSQSGERQLIKTSAIFQEQVLSKIDNINELTKIIRNISSQINLLSMNAAIEAAHAGDLGKGFAVVSGEIRSLAESTSVSVKKIDSTIKEIVTGIDETGENVNLATDAFRDVMISVTGFAEGLSEIAAGAGQLELSSKQILRDTAGLDNITTSVKNGAREINNGAAVINREMNSVKDISSGVFQGIKEVTLATEELTKTLHQLSGLTKELGEKSGLLHKEISRFKT